MWKIILKVNSEESKNFFLRFQRNRSNTSTNCAFLCHKPLRRKPSKQFYLHQYRKLLISLGFHFSIMLLGTKQHASHKLKNIKVTFVTLGVGETKKRVCKGICIQFLKYLINNKVNFSQDLMGFINLSFLSSYNLFFLSSYNF